MVDDIVITKFNVDPSVNEIQRRILNRAEKLYAVLFTSLRDFLGRKEKTV